MIRAGILPAKHQGKQWMIDVEAGIQALSDRTQQKLETVQSDGTVYFIQQEDDAAGPIKIGVSNNVAEHLWILQQYCPCKLRVLAVIPGGGALLKGKLHSRFASQRLHGEWFAVSPELLRYISSRTPPVAWAGR